jgi:hypothetical protein
MILQAVRHELVSEILASLIRRMYALSSGEQRLTHLTVFSSQQCPARCLPFFRLRVLPPMATANQIDITQHIIPGLTSHKQSVLYNGNAPITGSCMWNQNHIRVPESPSGLRIQEASYAHDYGRAMNRQSFRWT